MVVVDEEEVGDATLTTTQRSRQTRSPRCRCRRDESKDEEDDAGDDDNVITTPSSSTRPPRLGLTRGQRP